MASDITAVLAEGYLGSAPDWALSPSSVVYAGGVDYSGNEVDPHCAHFDADAVQCKGWRVGGSEDGLCAGHRKAAAKRAG